MNIDPNLITMLSSGGDRMGLLFFVLDLINQIKQQEAAAQYNSPIGSFYSSGGTDYTPVTEATKVKSNTEITYPSMPRGGGEIPIEATARATTPVGETKYQYMDFPKGQRSVDPDSDAMRTAYGLTLQKGALRSLIDVARQSDVLPGLGELTELGPIGSYRDPGVSDALHLDWIRGLRSAPAAAGGDSYHNAGLAVDIGAWRAFPQLYKLLNEQGWNQLSNEDWHWTYGAYG